MIFSTKTVENPPYLWVLDPDGNFLGLMKGPFPIKHLSRGYLQFAVQEAPYNMANKDWEAQWLKRVDLNISIWRQGDTYLFVIVTPDKLDLYKIRQFRWTTKRS